MGESGDDLFKREFAPNHRPEFIPSGDSRDLEPILGRLIEDVELPETIVPEPQS